MVARLGTRLSARSWLSKAVVAGIVVVLAAFGVALGLGTGNAVGPPSLSVLADPVTPLPADVLQREFIQEKFGSPPVTHLAFTRGGKSYYVAERPGGDVCLLLVEGVESDVSGTCADRSVFARTAVYVVVPRGHAVEIAGVVADGYGSASADGGPSSPVSHNAFTMTVPAAIGALDFRGTRGRLHVDVGITGP
jgi:hypothetical protein